VVDERRPAAEHAPKQDARCEQAEAVGDGVDGRGHLFRLRNMRMYQH
jgi:hypothetical protein